MFKRFMDAKASKFITPPYFSGKFNCNDCSKPCVKICDKELLSFKDEKIKFEVINQGCNFCEACAQACSESGREVINLKFKKDIAAKAIINVNSCLAWNDVMCYSCFDMCKYNAIEYFGVFRPAVNDRCNGCGECLSSCFKNAIMLKSL